MWPTPAGDSREGTVEGIETIGDLKPGMILEGVVTNVAAFGAFVDQSIPVFLSASISCLMPSNSNFSLKTC